MVSRGRGTWKGKREGGSEGGREEGREGVTSEQRRREWWAVREGRE